MKHWFNFILLSVMACTLFSSCKKETEEICEPSSISEPEDTLSTSLKVVFTPYWGEEPVMNGSEYVDQYGTRMLQFNFKTYVSDLAITNADGLVTEISEIELLELGTGEISITLESLDRSTYSELSFYTGVPSDYNVDYDPSTWPNSHPLSVQGAQGMHWSWNTGYIFTKFDGKADTTEAVNPSYLYPFSFHCGADEFYTEHTFQIEVNSLDQEVEEVELRIAIDMEKFLDGEEQINIRETNETHTGGNFELAQRFINNFNQSFRME